ncbi:MAG: globin family protein [Bacteroidota bacterium]
MTSQQILLVRNSWPQIQLIRELAGKLFYERLFELNPSLRPMFSEDIEPQTRKLMTTLQHVVSHLNRLEELLPQVRAMGQRHEDYGVKPEHYAPVGEALLWTLERGLGSAWTPELAEAWTAAYTILAEAMTNPAESHATA